MWRRRSKTPAVRLEPERCAKLVDEVDALCEALLVATATLSLEAPTP